MPSHDTNTIIVTSIFLGNCWWFAINGDLYSALVSHLFALVYPYMFMPLIFWCFFCVDSLFIICYRLFICSNYFFALCVSAFSVCDMFVLIFVVTDKFLFVYIGGGTYLRLLVCTGCVFTLICLVWCYNGYHVYYSLICIVDSVPFGFITGMHHSLGKICCLSFLRCEIYSLIIMSKSDSY